MNYDDILEELSQNLTLQSNFKITQKDIDNILEICKKNNLKESAWRLALTLGSLQKYDFMNYVKYFILERDSFYLSELVYVVYDIDLKQVYKLIEETNDTKFINEMNDYLMSYCSVKTKEELMETLKNISDTF